jgi:F0F1-type ATP synthase membrane subunit a
MTAAAAASTTPPVKTTLMDTFNSRSLITLLLFFVLQGLIYCACLVKLAEIRRQKVPARVQLRLLENEEHLFDAGLYLGFAGTIVCLILVSLGSIHFSLMAAYSCTAFGVIFVSIFKIFSLRPARRQLLMQSEVQAVAPGAAATTTAPSLVPTA